MIRRKKSASGRSSRRKRADSPSPPRRRGEDAVPPPEFRPYDYETLAIYFMKALRGQQYPFLSTGFVHLVHEIEEMLSVNNFTKDFMSGEMQYMNNGYYPTPDLNARMMPVYDLMPEEGDEPSPENSDTQASEAAPYDEEKEVEICLLPQEEEDDNFDEFPAYHLGTRFWAWCRKSFMGKIDSEYLENFKELFLEAYSQEALQKYFVNEPWRFRKKVAPPPSSRRKSQNTPQGKNAKKVSIANDATSPSTSTATTSSARIANRKASLSGYRIPNRRNSEKDQINNNKIVPLIGSVVSSAYRELKECKSTPDTPTTRRARVRMASRDSSREKERKCAKMEVDVDEDEVCNGSGSRFSPRMHSPRQSRKEKAEEDVDRLENGNSSGLTNGHAKNGEVSPKRRNGELKNNCKGSIKNEKNGTTRRQVENDSEELEMPSDIEDFDAKAIGSRIVAKLIAGGILPDSSAQIFEQMTLENDEEGGDVYPQIEMSEEGKEEAEEQEVGELAKELENLQMNLRDELPVKKALFMLAWRQAKAHFAFFHTFDELRRADYDLFKLGVNMYKEYPRKLPANNDMFVLRESLQKRNYLARMHYSKMYRRHPKFRWYKDHVPGGRRVAL